MLDLADVDGTVAAVSLNDDDGAMVWNGRIGQEVFPALGLTG